MATIKAVIEGRERKTDKTHLVMIRLTVATKSLYIGTGIYVPKKHWNLKATLDNANWVRTTNELCDIYNTAIKERIQEAQMKSIGIKDVASLKQLLTKKKTNPLSFTAFFSQELERVGQELSRRTHQRYTCNYNTLLSYLEGRELTFEGLTVEFLKRYEAYLLQGRRRNTVSKHLATLKTFILKAVAGGHMPYEKNPFLNFKLRLEKSSKARLNEEEMQRIIALHLSEGSTAHLVRAAFLLQFYMSGMRIGDLLTLRWEMIKDGRLEYRMQKTGMLKSLRLMPQAMALMEPFKKERGYILPLIPEGLKPEVLERRVAGATTLINRELKEIAAKAEIDKNISTHVARHSFASIAWGKTRDIKGISDALGHSAIRVTEVYLREMTHQEQDALLETAFADF